MNITLTKRELQVIQVALVQSNGYLEKDFLPEELSARAAYCITERLIEKIQLRLRPSAQDE
jgi:hypothetical protein